MLMALLYGKFSRDQVSEDLLTSNVFGTLKYLPPGTALIPFLRKAIAPEKEYPLADLSSDVEVKYEFWPWLGKSDNTGCEPDVLIRLTCSSNKKILILIEAKYRSGKSSEEEKEKDLNEELARKQSEEIATLRVDHSDESVKDQLSREWKNLRRLAERESAEPVLIYLTAGFACPTEDIEASQKALKGEKGKISWLSWRHLLSLITDSHSEMLRDLAAVLRRLDLIFFEGFSKVDTPVHTQWAFSAEPVRFDWTCLQIKEALQWRLRR
jgi:hypothetical protein